MKEKIKNIFKKFRHKYRLVIMDDDTLKESWSFKLSKMNVFVALGLLFIFLVFITAYIIAFTPLREFIPGYANANIVKRSYQNAVMIDSLERTIYNYDIMLKNIKMVISGDSIPEITYKSEKDTTVQYADVIENKRSKQDEKLRKDIESEDKYQLQSSSSSNDETLLSGNKNNIKSLFFFSPLKGMIMSRFNPGKQHYGIDIAGKQDESVKAVLDGIVIFSDWTYDAGYMIGIQHQENIISIYKHNSSLLKKTGDFVKAGTPIAFIGNTGKQTTGPHLHFELWNNGTPVNPLDYISF